MGFNYLQTDDRDDYFAQFDKKPKSTPKSYTLISPSGEIIFKEVPLFWIRRYSKKTYISKGQPAKYIWRKLLEDKGYTIQKNYEIKPNQ